MMPELTKRALFYSRQTNKEYIQRADIRVCMYKKPSLFCSFRKNLLRIILWLEIDKTLNYVKEQLTKL